MTPKEKAKELIGKYVFLTVKDFSDKNFEQTKQCALIAVDEAIEESYLVDKTYCRQEYWEEVKQEIQNL
jgi:hypothetical protein